jgi:hypothetical protein
MRLVCGRCDRVFHDEPRNGFLPDSCPECFPAAGRMRRVTAADEGTTMPRTDDGGPAYPLPGVLDAGDLARTPALWRAGDGMSLRDHFAGLALAGYIASYAVEGADADQAAARAFQYADAMLAERAK